MSWRDALPEKVKDWDEVKNAETADAFFDQIGNMRSMVGRSVRIPGEDASPEERQAFLNQVLEKGQGELLRKPSNDEEIVSLYKQLGMPAEHKDYKIALELPNGVVPDDKRIDTFRQLAHDAGLTQKQFEKLVAPVMQQEAEVHAAKQAKEAVLLAELKTNWGEQFDRKSAQAEMIRAEYFPFIPKDGYGADTLKALATLAHKLGVESTGLKDGDGQRGGSMTRDEAVLQISEITGNKTHPYWNPSDPGHEAARRKMRELNVIAYN